MDVERAHAATPACGERHGDLRLLDAPLGAALGVAESVAKRHGGEVRLRSGGDGGLIVELRFSIPALRA